MKLDTSAIFGAITSLEKSISEAQTHRGLLPAELEETVRSGIIQNFEVAYEQCWKTMKRWLEINISPDAGDGITRRELFRRAAEHLLISDVDAWMRFHAARNETSHTYNNTIAEDIFAVSREFLPTAKQFLAAVLARND